MGKAGVGLPDPLDSTAGSAGAAATDDLLAQLAGEEIDRLLADADDASPAAASTGLPSTDADVALGVPPASPTPAESSEKDPLTLLDEVQKRANAVEQTVKELAPPTPAKKGDGEEDPALSAELDALFQELNAPPASPDRPPVKPDQLPTAAAVAPSPAPKATDAGAGAAIDAELDALFQELNTAPGGATTKAGAATAAPAAPALGATSPVEAGTKNGEATDAADPLQTLDAELSAALVADADPEPVHAEAVDSLPVYLKPLEWLNAPFAGLSDALREAVGKVAIVTLVNAFAVLAYVVVFRGR